MRWPLLGLLACSALATGWCAASEVSSVQPGTALAEYQARVAAARDAVLPHVVSILVVREDFSQGRGQLTVSGGSGTIISTAGHIATNAHVTENGRRFRVVTADQRELSAHLVGVDTLSDIAVLQIDGAANGGFAFAHFAPQNELSAGDLVMAMGAPWGMAHSLTQGVVSNPNRLMLSFFQDEADYEQQLDRNQPTARYYAWIQHDASISPGNSGGPLVSLTGEIVGINTRSNLFGGDMAYAIPADIASRIVAALIKDGRVRRSFFGFSVRSLKGSGLADGVLVSSVQRGSPAEQAGLSAGDRILKIDGAPVRIVRPEQVPPFLRELTERTIGSTLELEISGAGSRQRLSMRSIEYPPDLGDNLEIKPWGLTLTEVTPAIARSLSLLSDRGLLVTGVAPGKRAATARPGLQVRDVITAIDGQAVANSADIAALALDNGQRAAAHVIAFERDGSSMLSALDAERAPGKGGLRELAKPWIGVATQPITASVAKALRLPASGGYRVIRVYPGPASTAGVRVGDLITAIDGQSVPVSGDENDAALQQRIRDADEQHAIELGLWRDGASLQVSVPLTVAPDAEGSLSSVQVDWLDLGVRALGFFDRVDRRLPADARGVVVERVEAGGLAGLAHLEVGDVVLKVNQVAIADIDEFARVTDRKSLRPGSSISFLVLRAQRTRLLFLDAGWELP